MFFIKSDERSGTQTASPGLSSVPTEEARPVVFLFYMGLPLFSNTLVLSVLERRTPTGILHKPVL